MKCAARWTGVPRLTGIAAPCDSAEARSLLERSVSLDPQFAPARAKLAEARVWDVTYGWTDAPQPTLDAALADARRAVALDPRDPSSHTDLAFALSLVGEMDEAVDEVRRASELNPSEPLALQYSAFLLTMAGHPPEESIALVQRAMRLSPHDPFEFFFYDELGVSYFCAGRYADGVAAGRRLMALRPTYTLGYIYAAMSAAELGHIDEARDLVRQARRVQTDLSFAVAHRALGGMAPDVDRRMSAALRKAGLE